MKRLWMIFVVLMILLCITACTSPPVFVLDDVAPNLPDNTTQSTPDTPTIPTEPSVPQTIEPITEPTVLETPSVSVPSEPDNEVSSVLEQEEVPTPTTEPPTTEPPVTEPPPTEPPYVTTMPWHSKCYVSMRALNVITTSLMP